MSEMKSKKTIIQVAICLAAAGYIGYELLDVGSLVSPKPVQQQTIVVPPPPVKAVAPTLAQQDLNDSHAAIVWETQQLSEAEAKLKRDRLNDEIDKIKHEKKMRDIAYNLQLADLALKKKQQTDSAPNMGGQFGSMPPGYAGGMPMQSSVTAQQPAPEKKPAPTLSGITQGKAYIVFNGQVLLLGQGESSNGVTVIAINESARSVKLTAKGKRYSLSVTSGGLRVLNPVPKVEQSDEDDDQDPEGINPDMDFQA